MAKQPARPPARVATTQGTIDVPVVYEQFSALHAYFLVRTERAETVLANTPFTAARLLGDRTVAGLACFDYQQTSVGPYREVALALAVVPRDARHPSLPLLDLARSATRRKVGFHILDLPVTTPIAEAAGRELWGFPKFVADIDIAIHGDALFAAVREHGGRGHIVRLEGKSSKTFALPSMDLVLYSRLGSEVLRSVATVRGRMGTGSGRGLTLGVTDGDHRMAARLRELGLDGAQPILIQRGEGLRAVLSAGLAVASEPAHEHGGRAALPTGSATLRLQPGSDSDCDTGEAGGQHHAGSTRRRLALVTGASSGIGAQLARELASDGYDLVLVSRSLEPMRILGEELIACGAGVSFLPLDLARTGAAAALVEELASRGLVIDVLINNAGFGAAGSFDESDPTCLARMLQLNVVSLTELTRYLLPGMVSRGWGRILLTASTGGFQPGPNMAAYCATKSYVLSLGQALADELRSTGVRVTTLCPGPTATNFARTANAETTWSFRSGFVMTAAEVARPAYRALKTGRVVAVTGAANVLTTVLSRWLPRPLTLWLTRKLLASR
jgi:uncharacterized protein